MTPERERTDPPYLQIAASIRADITAGKLAEGDTIPSARQITASWGVALATATRVLAQLRSEGLVRPVPGIGTVVAGASTGFGGDSRLRATRATGRIYRADEKAEIISAAVVSAPDNVADALGLPAGTDVVRRERVVRRSGEPVSSSVSWFPGSLASSAPKLLEMARILEGSFGYLQSVTGVQVERGREAVCAAAANTEQARSLNVEPGVPVMLTRTWFLAADHAVIEYGESARVAGCWSSHDFSTS